MNMGFQNDYIYKGIELLNEDLDLLNDIDKQIINIVCFHINNEGKLPFMQFLMYNNYGIPFLGCTFQEFIFPLLEINEDVKSNIQLSVKNQIKYLLSIIGCSHNNDDEIIIKGLYNNCNKYYLFVDISEISITPLYLKKTTPVWFALTNEIINQQHICNIPISKNVQDLLLSDYKLFTITNLQGENIQNPIVVYEGSHFKQTEFQSIFGVSKKDNNYVLLYSINDAFKNGSWNNTGKSELKFNKQITDNEFGRYSFGGINRIALIYSLNEYVNTDELAIDESEVFFDGCDLITCVKNGNQVAIIKDYNQQVSLSYHKIDKSTVGEKWDPNICYCIE